MKRPLSHVYAIFVYILFVALCLMKLSRGVRDPASLAVGAFCLLQLLGAFAAPREPRQYKLGMVVLVLVAMDVMYDLVLTPGYQLYSHAAGTHATWSMVIVNAGAVGVLLYLAYDYAFSAASRAFFGLPPLKKK
jgi:hypothetical protein